MHSESSILLYVASNDLMQSKKVTQDIFQLCLFLRTFSNIQFRTFSNFAFFLGHFPTTLFLIGHFPTKIFGHFPTSQVFYDKFQLNTFLWFSNLFFRPFSACPGLHTILVPFGYVHIDITRQLLSFINISVHWKKKLQYIAQRV